MNTGTCPECHGHHIPLFNGRLTPHGRVVVRDAVQIHTVDACDGAGQLVAAESAFPDPVVAALTACRRARGWSQGELARRMNRQRPSVSRTEAGTTTPTLEYLRLIADALDCDIAVVPRRGVS